MPAEFPVVLCRYRPYFYNELYSAEELCCHGHRQPDWVGGNASFKGSSLCTTYWCQDSKLLNIHLHNGDIQFVGLHHNLIGMWRIRYWRMTSGHKGREAATVVAVSRVSRVTRDAFLTCTRNHSLTKVTNIIDSTYIAMIGYWPFTVPHSWSWWEVAITCTTETRVAKVCCNPKTSFWIRPASLKLFGRTALLHFM